MRKIAEKILPITVTALCLAEMIAFGTEPMSWGVLPSVAHNFVHANWAHLAVNAISLWFINPKLPAFLLGVAGGTLAWMICTPFIQSTPVGLSDTLFCVIGYITASRPWKWWKTEWFKSVLSVLVLTTLIPGLSGATHTVSLGIGLLWGSAARAMDKVKSDYDKAGGNRRHSS